MNEIAVSARLGGGPPAPLFSIDPIGTAIVDLGDDRGTFVIYDRNDRPSIAAKVPATGKLIKVSMRSGAMLDGASPSEHGAKRVHRAPPAHGHAVRFRRPHPSSRARPSARKVGRASTNTGRGPAASPSRPFVRSEISEGDICGLDVTVRDWNQQSFMIDDIRVAAAEDSSR